MKLPKGMGERAGWSTVAGAVHLFISYTIIVLTQNEDGGALYSSMYPFLTAL